MKQERSILAGGCFWGRQELSRDGELMRTEQGAGYVLAASAEIARWNLVEKERNADETR